MKQKNPKCLFSLKFDKSVSSAYYSPLTGNHLLLTSLDDRLRCEQACVCTWIVALMCVLFDCLHMHMEQG